MVCVCVRQICGGYPDALTHCAQLIEEHATVDFVDINMGCPIDIICNRRVASNAAAVLCHSSCPGRSSPAGQDVVELCSLAGRQSESAWVLPSRGCLPPTADVPLMPGSGRTGMQGRRCSRGRRAWSRSCAACPACCPARSPSRWG